MKRRRATRGMLSGVAFVLLVNVGLSAALETAAPHLRDPEAGWRLKKLKPLAVAGPVIVALGTSRTQMVLDPAEFPTDQLPVFNFGQAGAGPVVQRLNLERILAAGIEPAGVFVELMPATLHQDGPAEPALAPFASRYSADDIGRIRDYCDDTAPLWKEWAAARAAPVYSGRMLLLSHVAPGLLPWQQRVDFQWRMMTDRGFTPFPFEHVPDDYRAAGIERDRQKYETMLRTYRTSETPRRAVLDLCARCDGLGIPVAFYLLPETPAFRSWTTPEGEANLNAFLTELRANHTVFDCRDWLPETAFADGHHALKRGAKVFSERFGRECLPRAFE